MCTVEPTRGSEGPGDIDNAGTLGFNIAVHPGDDVSCTVVDRELTVLENPGPTDSPTDTPEVLIILGAVLLFGTGLALAARRRTVS